jgi:Flp pilus assembly protein TadG
MARATRFGLFNSADRIRSRKLRRSHRGGSTIVEAAVIFLPFLAMFFAIFDFGMALFMQNTMQFAVRQGVRYAITSQTITGSNQDASINAVVQQDSFGFLSYLGAGGTNPSCVGTAYGRACVNISYYRQTLGTPPTLTLVTGTGSNSQSNLVQITVSGLNYNWMIPLLRSATPLTFSVSSAAIMEAQPNGPPTR